MRSILGIKKALKLFLLFIGGIMFPYFYLFNKQITMYSVMTLIGIFLCGFIACKLIKKEINDTYNMIILLLLSALGIFIGGHILYGITNIEFIFRLFSHLNVIDSFKDVIDVFVYIFGGSVFYGGLLGGMLIGSVYIKKKKLNKKIYYDICAIIIPLFHAFGRIGCFLVGCCYGIESKIGFTYTKALVQSANGINRFPVQLLESSCNFIIFFFLFAIYKREKCQGKLLYIYLVSYAIIRFILEFLRGDSYRGFVLGLSTSQIISIGIFIIVFIKLLKNKAKMKI